MPQPEHLAGYPGRANTGLVPEVAGILTVDQVLATGRAIAADQQDDGAIGWPDGHVDAWNHIECAMALSVCGLREPARRAYAWLAGAQEANGSWPVRAADGLAGEWAAESNHAAYCAVGVWHELLVTGDSDFATAMWPTVRAGIEFALGLQQPRGEIIWRRHADGSPDDYALLAGSSSMYASLRCAIALAEYAADPQPDWELAAGLLGHAAACHGEAFADKSRYSMDWYYPVLGGPVRGPAAERMLRAGWDTFVVPGLGVRCVSDEPWVTGAETCELAIAMDAIGCHDEALDLFEQVQFLRAPGGGYWTGWQFVHQAHFPREQSSWTAAAIVLAADALAEAGTGAAGLFGAVAAGPGVWQPSDPATCGCQASSRDGAGSPDSVPRALQDS